MKRMLCGLLVLLLLVGGAPTASANSAQSYWEGVDRAGVIITDGESPIVVEHELLTFDLQEFPKNHYFSEEDFLAYTGRVTAQYTFHNPSALTVTAKLLFPFGQTPWYADFVDTQEDARKYDILVDGQPIDKKLRYTLSDKELFSVEHDLDLIYDALKSDDFYTPEQTVTRYVFSVSDVGGDTQYPDATIGFDIPKGGTTQRFFFPEWKNSPQLNKGKMRVILSDEDSFCFYVFGSALETLPEFTFYQNSDAKDGEEIPGTVTLTDSTTITFEDFALAHWAEYTGISATDWYNAVVDDLNVSYLNTAYPILYRDHHNPLSRRLMRWYEYEITLAPGQRIVNTVTAPIYPSINTNYNPDVYGYTYLLSPAKTWKSFGTLEIVVNTPYYITESSLEGFERTETGYKLTLDGLPDGELTFQLCSSENPKAPKTNIFYGFIYIVAMIFSYIGYLFRSFFDAIGSLF